MEQCIRAEKCAVMTPMRLDTVEPHVVLVHALSALLNAKIHVVMIILAVILLVVVLIATKTMVESKTIGEA
jgi:hypothetical protein